MAARTAGIDRMMALPSCTPVGFINGSGCSGASRGLYWVRTSPHRTCCHNIKPLYIVISVQNIHLLSFTFSLHHCSIICRLPTSGAHFLQSSPLGLYSWTPLGGPCPRPPDKLLPISWTRPLDVLGWVASQNLPICVGRVDRAHR